MNILVINGHDYTRWIEDGGYDWSRDDLDSEKTVRVKTGNIRRDKITEKRNLSYKMLAMPEELAAQLDRRGRTRDNQSGGDRRHHGRLIYVCGPNVVKNLTTSGPRGERVSNDRRS